MHDFDSVLVPLIFFGFLTAVIVGPRYLRSRDQARLYDTVRAAYEKGQPVPPELISALQTDGAPPRRMDTPERDLRRAIILIAVGLGMAGLGYGLWYGLMSVNDISAYITGGSVAGSGAIPGMLGVAYFILWLTRRNAPKA